MAFCANCGTELKEARFCPSCGTAAGETSAAPASRTVTVGQVKKCPSCGSPIESFQSRCNACGHELGDIKTSFAIKEFSTELNTLDEKIAREKNPPGKPAAKSSSGRSGSRNKTLAAGAAGALIGASLAGGSSRSSSNSRRSAAGGLVGIGIFVGAIALIVKIIKNFKNAIAKPHLTASEKTKKSYVENFVIPNTREDMLEFVLLASSKAESVIDLGQGQSMAEIASAHFWTKVWENKCKKVEDRALIALQGDTETLAHIKRFHDRSKDAYNNITKAKKKSQIKSVILFFLMLIAIAAIAAIALLLLLILL